MILSRLSDYLRAHGRASLHDLQQHLDSDPEVLEDMLARLERKGRVRRLPGGSLCGESGTCCKCDPSTLVIYEWAAEADAIVRSRT